MQALKGAATSGPGQQELLQKELAYAEAQAARFANGTAMLPERTIAQQRYAELMEGIGVHLLPGLNMPVQGARGILHCRLPVNRAVWVSRPIGWRKEASGGVCNEDLGMLTAVGTVQGRGTEMRMQRRWQRRRI